MNPIIEQIKQAAFIDELEKMAGADKVKYQPLDPDQSRRIYNADQSKEVREMSAPASAVTPISRPAADTSNMVVKQDSVKTL